MRRVGSIDDSELRRAQAKWVKLFVRLWGMPHAVHKRSKGMCRCVPAWPSTAVLF